MQTIDICPLIALVPVSLHQQSAQYVESRLPELLVSSAEVAALLHLFCVARTAVASGGAECWCNLEEALQALSDLEGEMRESLV
ncbi:hypothetical protein [Ralstonia mojiangensis]|uniref:hypothetical protein n=1 Tax=Ralstonia mojiangensis TaxID=2953895 RepID=UPI0021B3A0F9|nr:hypothetical protein [Ralstonia mojiangensis]MCT7325026.1 hypothetical protein [Ralstonia mojiangensis]